MNTINMPGFTAVDLLYRTSGRYQMTTSSTHRVRRLGYAIKRLTQPTSGDVDFQPRGLQSVDKPAIFLKEYPSRNVIIEGHTDSTGPKQYNQRLSQKRAKVVSDALMMKGLNSARI